MNTTVLSAEDMEVLIEYILGHIRMEKRNTTEISNYAIVRMAAKTFHLYIYWKGKTLKGQQRLVKIELGADISHAGFALTAMEKIIEEAPQFSLTAMIDRKKKAEDNPVNTWGEASVKK